jgi:hypothetical protein
MRTFTDYHHPVKGYEAVKKGPRGPDCFVRWGWAFVSRLVVIGVVCLSVWLFAAELCGPHEPDVIFLYFAITLAVNLLGGSRENKWREDSLAA